MKRTIFHAIILSLFLSACIFAFGLFANVLLDGFKLSRIETIYQENALRSTSFLIEQQLFEFDSEYECQALDRQLKSLRDSISEFTEDISLYRGRSLLLEPDFNYWKRKHILLQIQLLSLIEYTNKRCDSDNIPVLFFFSDGSEASVTQTTILQRLNQDELAVLYFDIDFDEEPALLYLKERYNVSSPVIIFPTEQFPVITNRRTLLEHISSYLAEQ